MKDCCHTKCSSDSQSRKHTCPVNGQEYKSVAFKTILHHIKSPWDWVEKQQDYFFCDDPNCEVVYFGGDDSVITTSETRTLVGKKACTPDSLTCYCFGVSNQEAQQYPNIRDFVVDKISTGMCSCETSNPSGRCCLKDYPAKEASSH